VVAVVAALGSAALAALGTALQHRSATEVAGSRPDTGPRLAGFVRAQATHPLLLASFVLDAVGVGCQALALHFGTLARVQPLLVTTLVFALPINHWIRREPISIRELRWSLVLVAGLAGFLVLTQPPGPEQGAHPAGPGPAIGAAVLAVLAVGGCVAAARRSSAGAAAALLGTGTGVAFAGTAALLKTCTDLLAHGVVALLVSWPVYALLAVGATGLLLQQLAFRDGPLSASLPAITIVDPLVSIVLGVVVYDDHLRRAAPALAGALACLAVFVVAAVILTRLEHGHPSAESAGE
jgi:drug/metabolite transporter (DMT)-like permease